MLGIDRLGGRQGLGLAVGALVASGMGWGSVAWACSPSAYLDQSLSPGSGPPGTAVLVTGHEFYSNAPVQLYWESTSGPLLASTNATVKGDIAVRVTIPSAPAKVDIIVAVSPASGYGPWSAPFQVTPGGQVTTPGGSTSAMAPPTQPITFSTLGAQGPVAPPSTSAQGPVTPPGSLVTSTGSDTLAPTSVSHSANPSPQIVTAPQPGVSTTAPAGAGDRSLIPMPAAVPPPAASIGTSTTGQSVAAGSPATAFPASSPIGASPATTTGSVPSLSGLGSSPTANPALWSGLSAPSGSGGTPIATIPSSIAGGPRSTTATELGIGLVGLGAVALGGAGLLVASSRRRGRARA